MTQGDIIEEITALKAQVDDKEILDLTLSGRRLRKSALELKEGLFER